MSNRLAHLADNRIFNTPLAIHPMKADIILAALAERLGIVSLDNFAPRPYARLDEDESAFKAEDDRDSDYEVYNGVALIDVRGTLVQESGWLRPFSGMTGYDGLRQNYLYALRDPKVKGIAFVIRSPGGEVAGLFDFTDLIAKYRGEKPHIAICSEYAYSAAFAIAAATGNVVLPRTGGVGSVGVIVIHAELSRALADRGIKPTIITYGDRKADGRPELPLSKEARERMQTEVDRLGELFVTSIAGYLNISTKGVINTQAGCFMGQSAVEVGFATKVAAPDEALREFIKEL